jgi:hypothetical protein
MNTKEINKAIESLLGIEVYDLRHCLKIMEDYTRLSYEEAKEGLAIEADNFYNEEPHQYTITSSLPEAYTEDLNLAIEAVKKLSDKIPVGTFVLSYEDGSWKAAMGNWGDCAEYTGASPAYVTCVALLKYFQKI